MRPVLHLATGNAHKVRELSALARLYPVVTAGGVDDVDREPRPVELVVPAPLPQVAEDTGTFIGNARKKAAALQRMLPPDAWVLADDSGLAVDALGGGPGVESAYYAGPQADWEANLRKLVEEMREVPDDRRQAGFFCVLVVLGPAGLAQVFEGRCEGRLAREPIGIGGFGYDPLFVPCGETCTYAQLGEDAKNRISHRAHAWRKLVEWLGRQASK